MRWPWVGRLAYDSVVSERDSLREQVRRLEDALTRIGRKEAGLPEAPRPPRQSPLQPMPDELHDYLNGFANPSQAKMLRDKLYRRHAAGEPWSRIVADVVPAEPEEPEDD